jgi:hypothetical protein
LAASGETVAVGAAPACYIFVRNGSIWSQQAQLTASNPTLTSSFGFSVAASGDQVAVGDAGNERAYLFVRSGTNWSLQANLLASNPDRDWFATSVAISNGTVVVGAPQEDSSTSGVNSIPNERIPDSGAAYVYRNAPNSTAPVLYSVSTPFNPALWGLPNTLTITGIGFDPNSVEVIIEGGVVPNSSITTKTSTLLIFTVNLLPREGQNSIIVRNSNFGAASNELTLNAKGRPVSTGISPAPGTAGPNTVTITGFGFDPKMVQVEIGASVIPNASLTSKTGDELRFTTMLQAGEYSVRLRDGPTGLASLSSVTLNIRPLTAGPGAAGSHFVPIAPCRAADTRPNSILVAGSTRDFSFASCGVPASATAVALNVTIVPSGQFSYLSIFPAGQSQPVVSTMNSLDGRIKANAAIVGLGVNSAVTLFATDQTHAILEVSGYFVPAGTSGALAFYPSTPCRVVDTRNNGGIIPAQGTRLINGGCLPANAQAYSLNVTSVPPGPLGFLACWHLATNGVHAQQPHRNRGRQRRDPAVGHGRRVQRLRDRCLALHRRSQRILRASGTAGCAGFLSVYALPGPGYTRYGSGYGSR